MLETLKETEQELQQHYDCLVMQDELSKTIILCLIEFREGKLTLEEAYRTIFKKYRQTGPWL